MPSTATFNPDLYPFNPNYLDLKGLRYHYVDEGPRDGEPILMVHGNPTWSFYYRNLIRAMSPNYRVIAPDHIGMGRSDKPSEERYTYTLDNRINDLDALIDHLGLDTFSLVVHDWGGMIGTAWAVRNPERINRLILLNTAAFNLPRSKSFPAALRLARVPVLGESLVRRFSAFSRGANRFCVTQSKLAPEVAAGYLAPYANWDQRIAVHRFVTDIPLSQNDPAWDTVEYTSQNLERIAHIPTLLCWGMRDFVFDRHFLAEWERRLPNATVRRWEQSGHYILEDSKDEVISTIQTFFQENP